MVSLCVERESEPAIGPTLESNGNGLIRVKERDSVGSPYGSQCYSNPCQCSRRDVYRHCEVRAASLVKVWRGERKLTLTVREET